MKHKLSVLVPCKDEQANIRLCIESFVGIADEILIADSGSTDRTMEIAREFPKVKIIEREYRTSGDFKNWAIPQAAHEWILLVDADERVTEELAEEITTVLSGQPKHDGYWIYRNNHFMGHQVKYGDAATDKVIRLFRRDVCRYEGPSDHGEVHVQTENIGTLKTKFDHYTYWSYDQLFKKFHRYTTVQAEQWAEVQKDTSYFKLLIRPAFRFFREYVLQLGFLNGKAGVQLAMLAAFYSFVKQGRLWELNHAKSQFIPAEDRQSDSPIADSQYTVKFENHHSEDQNPENRPESVEGSKVENQSSRIRKSA